MTAALGPDKEDSCLLTPVQFANTRKVLLATPLQSTDSAPLRCDFFPALTRLSEGWLPVMCHGKVAKMGCC
jgi:hypothetical protein